jgi:predicted RNase H-like nuclease (RuvC/YqgF family)
MQVIFDKEIENLNSLVKLRKSIEKLEKENKELKLKLEDIEYDIELLYKR